MKRLFTLLTVLLCAILSAFAQGDSPYARFGYEGKVLRTPQERQQRMMLVVSNPDTTATVAKVGLDPAKQKYYLFDKQNRVLVSDTLVGTTVSRFLSTDPLTRSYPHLTPYQFASNTPIQAIDLDGLEAVYYGSQATSGYDLADINRDGKVTKLEQGNYNKVMAGMIAAGAIVNGGIIAGPSILLRIAASSAGRYLITNPGAVQTASGVAIGITAAIVGYDGTDLPGPEDDFARMGRKGYEKLAERGLSNEEIGGVARQSYNKILGTIDDEVRELGTLEEKAKKAFDIRNQAKDFARELSGPENAAAAEAISAGKHGSSKGPTFEYLVEKAKKAGKSADEGYQSIIESSKRTDPGINTKYDPKR
jgi:hypothetical protein